MERNTRIEDLLRQLGCLEQKLELSKQNHLIRLDELKAEQNALEKEKEFLQHE